METFIVQLHRIESRATRGIGADFKGRGGGYMGRDAAEAAQGILLHCSELPVSTIRLEGSVPGPQYGPVNIVPLGKDGLAQVRSALQAILPPEITLE